MVYDHVSSNKIVILAISETQGSPKGHQQIWEGPIAYHTIVQKNMPGKFEGYRLKQNDVRGQA